MGKKATVVPSRRRHGATTVPGRPPSDRAARPDCRQSGHPALDQRADRHRRGAPQFLDVEAIDRLTKRRFPRRKEALARAFQPDQTTLDRDLLADILKWLQL